MYFVLYLSKSYFCFFFRFFFVFLFSLFQLFALLSEKRRNPLNWFIYLCIHFAKRLHDSPTFLTLTVTCSFHWLTLQSLNNINFKTSRTWSRYDVLLRNGKAGFQVTRDWEVGDNIFFFWKVFAALFFKSKSKNFQKNFVKKK